VKIIIKGDRNTGKTRYIIFIILKSLFKRLQGQLFTESYIPTEKISTANVNWNYKNSSDIIKVDVWYLYNLKKRDVVDEAKEKKTNEEVEFDEKNGKDKLNKKVDSFRIDTNKIREGSHQLSFLDASLIDVYKNTHCVFLIFDITKNWTFEYVKKEVPKVPLSIEICILVR
jgi:GTPase SAR1 family protein